MRQKASRAVLLTVAKLHVQHLVELWVFLAALCGVAIDTSSAACVAAGKDKLVQALHAEYEAAQQRGHLPLQVWSVLQAVLTSGLGEQRPDILAAAMLGDPLYALAEVVAANADERALRLYRTLRPQAVQEDCTLG